MSLDTEQTNTRQKWLIFEIISSTERYEIVFLIQGLPFIWKRTLEGLDGLRVA